MSDELSFLEKLSQTVVDGKLDLSLVGDIENLETVDEETSEWSGEEEELLQLKIQSESIISKLDIDQQSLTQNRYETTDTHCSINSDEFVLSVKDSNLNRLVEARVLNEKNDLDSETTSQLIHEALVLSYLDHPGIPPVYDLDMSENNIIYCTLKRINGIQLSGLCKEQKNSANEHLTALDTISEILNHFIKISEIVSYAHKKNIIHRNLKPENFIVGSFGEVYVTAWGNAFDIEHDEPDFETLRGTPIYMSPEQASCQPVDKRTDIYALGASVFHMILKRPPVVRDNLDDFWSAKRAGDVDIYETGKDRPIDKPLLAICMRCLEANPDKRYQHVDDLIEDLRHYQSGQIVEVHKYGIMDLLGYWIAHNTTNLKWAGSILLLAVVAGLIFFQLYLREQSGWGNPVYTETFSDSDAWREEWALRERKDDEYHVEDGRLVLRKGPDFTWFYKRQLHGGVAIEFEGEMLPGTPPGDLSIVYSPDIENFESGGTARSVYYLQHGAVGNACSMIDGPHGRLAFADKVLEPGVKYKIRGEIDGKHLRLYLNDELVCAYDLLFPMNSGYIGLYGFYEGKAIDNIKIYNRQLPAVTNIIKTGDLLLENGLYDLAIERYQKISDQYGDSEIGQEGKYKLGLCYYKKEEIDTAFQIWDAMQNTPFAMQITFYRWEQLVQQEAYEELLRQMYAMYRSADAQTQTQIREQWGRYLVHVRLYSTVDMVREFLRFRDVSFPNDQIFSRETYRTLLMLGEPERALKLFPKQDIVVTSALLEMGEYQRVIKEYPNQYGAVVSALFNTGQFERIVQDYQDLPGRRIEALMALRRYDQALAEYPDHPTLKRRIMQMRGQFDKVLEEFELGEKAMESLLYDMGATKRYIAFRAGQRDQDDDKGEDKNNHYVYDAQIRLLLDRYMSGDKNALQKIREKNTNIGYYVRINRASVFHYDLLPEVLLCMEGEKGQLERKLDTVWNEKRPIMGMRHWYNVGLLAGNLGRDEYFAQPNQLSLQRDYLFYAGLHQDIFGDREKAVQLYEELFALPHADQYRSHTINALVQYRLRSLNNH